jgi:hypothetical protein
MTINIPVFADTNRLLMAIFNEFFSGQDVAIRTLFSEEMPTPAIVARRERRSGNGEARGADPRFVEPAVVAVNTITSGLEAESEGSELQEMCRIALLQAQMEQRTYPGIGHIANSTAASRVSDWATSTGIVQYAALPKGAVRFESVFRLLIRPPASGGVNNRFRPLH